jgi:hypothetical protein
MNHSLKATLAGLTLLFTVSFNLSAQQAKPDPRMQLLKEDPNNKFRSHEITQLDLLHALEVVGIGVQKFELGRFDREYQLHIFAETYENGEITRTDTLWADNNEYVYFERGETDYFVDYIDQLKFITKSEDNRCELRMHTYAFSAKRAIELRKWDDDQFYNWRAYSDTHWELNKKVPLMVFASSWEDKQYGFHRFCGVVTLREGTEGTRELLESSPTYVMISYRVSPVEKSGASSAGSR